MPVGAIIEAFLEHAEIPFARAGEGRWAFQLAGERKLSIPVGIAVIGDRLTIESFFMRKPQENLDRFYEFILRRNMRAYGIHFALDAIGDVYLVCARAVAGLDDAELDRLIGAVLVESDGSFDAAIAIGFESYLAADMKWRAAQGTPNTQSATEDASNTERA